MKFQKLHHQAKRASRLLKAIGNERRLMVLCHLADGEKSVGALEDLVGLSQSALSQHLARLRRDNIVRTRRAAQTIYYSLAAGAPIGLLQSLHELFDPDGPQDCAGGNTAKATGADSH
ncbi:MAG TPA: metalloregulator ArsR/SmtB family transcription factor [Alphaproteobacteria bacterium]|nr:metalloregulator ArsR/SmtB family transcription factor [Alphaproteobacteria bacterium]